MRMVIREYALDLTPEVQYIYFPVGAEPMSCRWFQGRVRLYVKVDPEKIGGEDDVYPLATITLAATDDVMYPPPGNYLGTIYSARAFHVYVDMGEQP